MNRNGVWPGPHSSSSRREKRGVSKEGAKSSRDSGIDERRESMSLTCSNCQQSSCADSASCNDNSDDQGKDATFSKFNEGIPIFYHYLRKQTETLIKFSSGFEYVRHHRQGSCGSGKLNRRHKSASPSRRSGRGSKGSRPNSKGGGYIQEGGSHSRGHSQTRGPGGEPRSKSAGHLTQQSCHHHCHCNCESERR